MPVARPMPLAISPPPKPMPTAMPSGKLWMVMAITNSQIRLSAALPPSRPAMKCSCGASAFSAATAAAPSPSPAPAISAATAVLPWRPSAASIAGIIIDK